MSAKRANLISLLIALLILFLSFFSILVANNLDRAIIEPTNNYNQPGNLTYELQNILDNSLYGLQPVSGGGRPLEYYILSYKFINQYYNPSTSSDGDSQTVEESGNTVTNFVTSRTNIRQFDPLDLTIEDFSGKNVILAKGHYNRNDGVEYSVEVTDSENRKLNQYAEVLEKIIPIVYNINKAYGIIDLSFAYVIDIDTEGFVQFDDYIDLNRSIIPNLFIMGVFSIIVIVIITFLIKYEYTHIIGYMKWIKRIPIELIVIFQLIWFYPLSYGIYFESSYLENLVLYLIAFVLISTIQVLFVYYTLGVKSLFINGLDNFIIRNSIIINILKTIYRQIKKLGKLIMSSTESLGVRAALLTCLLIFLSTSILLIINVNIVLKIILLLIIVLLIYNFLKKYFREVKVIEKFSKEISDGNYEAKLDEDKVNFKNISHNLNTIKDNLNLAVDEAIKSERMKSELVTNVSHDLKTPLTSIINYSHLIHSEEDPEIIKNYAGIIYERSTRLKILIEDLFEVTKANTNNIELQYQLLDFGQLVQQAVGEWEDKLNEKNLCVELDIKEDKILIELDGNKTYRILDNLLSNIYKYSLENTRVYIDLYIEEKIILIMKNISKYPLNISSTELMERFTRGDESRHTEGSGLGLAISKSLVEAQNGDFNIEIIGDLYMVIIKFPLENNSKIN